MVRRYSELPLIYPENVEPFDKRFEVIGAFNPGVAEFGGKTLLLVRVAVRPRAEGNVLRVPVLKDGRIDVLELDKSEFDCSDSRLAVGREKSYLTSMSYFAVALSEDGVRFEVDGSRVLLPEDELEAYGIEDPRITYIDGYYYIVYSAVSEVGICGMMKRTKDFKTYEKIGAVLHPDNKDAALFPEKIGGKYYMLHRPSTSEFGPPDIWIAESENLRDWGNHRHVLGVRPGSWDCRRIGSSGIPVLTDRGWLVVYHGANESNTYCLGAILLKKDEPWKVLGRTEQPFLKPELPCEKEGFFCNVVFACGGIERGGMLKIYYGAADKFVCGAEIGISEIMETLK